MARTRASRVRGVVLLLALAACDSNPAGAPTGSIVPERGKNLGAASAQAPGGNPHISEGTGMGAPPAPAKVPIHWTVPTAWKVAESPSRMRIATYKTPKADGAAEEGELSVSQVGGDVPSNIARWKGQFGGTSEPKIEERAVGDLKVTLVQIEGTFAGMAMPGSAPAGPKEGYALLGAVVVWPGHGDPYFFKLTGPKATVDAARPAFEELVTSLMHD